MRIRALALATLGIASLAFSARGGLWVIDWPFHPGVYTTHLQTTIDLAFPGDVIVANIYGTHTEYLEIDGKGLTIIGNQETQFEIGTLTYAPNPFYGHVIRNIPAGQTVYLRNFEFLSAWPDHYDPKTTFLVEDCAGEVVFEDCDFSGGSPAIEIRNSPNVTLVRCRAVLYPTGTISGRIESSGVHAYESYWHALKGSKATYINDQAYPSTPGLSALEITGNSTVVLGSSTLIGGKGGDGTNTAQIGCDKGSAGGHAILVPDAATEVIAIGSTIEGGAAGFWPGCGSGPAAPGAAAFGMGSYTAIEASVGSVKTTPRAIQQGEYLDFAMKGSPGETAILIVGYFPTSSYLPQGKGSLLIGDPAPILLFPGPIQADGTLHATAQTAPLPWWLAAGRVIAQIATCTPGGNCVLGSSSLAIVAYQLPSD